MMSPSPIPTLDRPVAARAARSCSLAVVRRRAPLVISPKAFLQFRSARSLPGWPVACLCPCRVAHSQLAYGVHEIVRGDVDLAGPLDVRQPDEQLAISLFQLDLGDPFSEADMWPVAEGDMLVGIRPRDIQ